MAIPRKIGAFAIILTLLISQMSWAQDIQNIYDLNISQVLVSGDFYEMPTIEEESFQTLPLAKQEENIAAMLRGKKYSLFKKGLIYAAILDVAKLAAIGTSTYTIYTYGWSFYHLLGGANRDWILKNPVIPASIFLLVHGFMNDPLPSLSVNTNNPYLAMGLILFKGIFSNFWWSAKAMSRLPSSLQQIITGKMPFFDPLEKTEIKYLVNRRDIPLDLRKSIESKLFASRVDGKAVNTAIEFVANATKLPLRSKEIYFDTNKFEDYFGSYSSKEKAVFDDFLYRQTILSEMETRGDHKSFEAMGRYALFLQGEPGTGKSYSAGLMAKFLGVNLAKTSLEKGSLEDIVGSATKIGSLFESLIAANPTSGLGTKNLVLLIDEFDRPFADADNSELLSFVLKLLDPSTKTIYSPYFKAEIELPHTIVLTGNLGVDDNALKDRLVILQLEGFNKEMKRKILFEETLPWLQKLLAINGKNLVLSEENHLTIGQMIENDSSKSIRPLQRDVKFYLERLRRDQQKQ